MLLFNFGNQSGDNNDNVGEEDRSDDDENDDRKCSIGETKQNRVKKKEKERRTALSQQH